MTSHYSYQSCKNIGNIFQFMFPDSFIAQTLYLVLRQRNSARWNCIVGNRNTFEIQFQASHRSVLMHDDKK
jgi:hypothetical protein